MKRPSMRDLALADGGHHHQRHGHPDRRRIPDRIGPPGRNGDDPILRSGHRPHRDVQRGANRDRPARPDPETAPVRRRSGTRGR